MIEKAQQTQTGNAKKLRDRTPLAMRDLGLAVVVIHGKILIVQRQCLKNYQECQSKEG